MAKLYRVLVNTATGDTYLHEAGTPVTPGRYGHVVDLGNDWPNMKEMAAVIAARAYRAGWKDRNARP